MNEDVGKMKPWFLWQTMLGVTTVSTKTTQQSKWKVIYSFIWLLIYVYDSIALMKLHATHGFHDISFLTLQSASYIITFDILLKSMLDYKTQLAAVLNLQEAQNLLESENIKIIPLTKVYILVSTTVLLWEVLSIVTVTILLWLNFINGTSITSFLTVFHSSAMFMTITTVFCSILNKVFIISRSIHQNLIKGLFDKNSVDQLKIKIRVIKEIKGSLNNVICAVQVYFWPSVTFILIRISISIPRFIYYSGVGKSQGLTPYDLIVTSFLVSSALYCFSHIHLSELVFNMSDETVTDYGVLVINTSNDKIRNDIKHLMLAELHRKQLTYSPFYDLEYSLVNDILDTCVLVFTTMPETE